MIKHIFAQWLCEYAYNLNNLRTFFRLAFVFSSGIISNQVFVLLEKNLIDDFSVIIIILRIINK